MEEKKFEDILPLMIGDADDEETVTPSDIELMRKVLGPVAKLYDASNQLEEFLQPMLSSNNGNFTMDVNLQKSIMSIVETCGKKVHPYLPFYDQLDEIMEKHGGEMYEEWDFIHEEAVMGHAWLLTIIKILKESRGSYTPLQLRKELVGFFDFQNNLELASNSYQKAKKDPTLREKMRIYDKIIPNFLGYMVEAAEKFSESALFEDTDELLQEIERLDG